MFVPKALIDWITTVKLDEGNKLREELAAIRAERDAIKTELIGAKLNSDWLRMQVNTLQLERTALMEKVYNIKVPAPEIVRQHVRDAVDPKDFSFDDMGDEVAKRFGFPLYDSTPGNAS